jgi:cell division septal protein FtsQ
MRSITKISLFVFFFILSSSYNPQKNYFHIKVIFPIKNIIIENTKTVNPNELKKEFRYLLEKSIFFIDKKIIRKVVLNNEFISSIKIKKIYPNTIKIIVNEEKPIAIQVLGNKKFYVTNENLLIKFYDLETYKNLPLIFGKQEGFNSLYILLNNIEFPLNEVKAFYYFDIKRWDISLKSNRIIKLPVENYLSSLKNYMKIKDNRSFDKYEIFDYRIKDQLILK